MKLNKALIVTGKPFEMEDDIDFSSVQFDPMLVKRIEKVHVKLTANSFEDLIHIDLIIHANIVGISSYTLKEVPLELRIKDCLEYTDDEENESAIYVKDNFIDLDEEILSIILTNIPIRIIGKGEKMPQNGDGYRVIDEETVEKERKGNHQFDALDALDFD